MKKYIPQKIEKKWQKKWYASADFKAKNFSKKKKFYLLFEFPYPSGEGLHVGHCRPYVGLDVIARKKRMEGLNVLFPMGWDAFGLPTENYAIKMGIKPALATKRNTTNFKRQMNMLGLSLDWSREVNTTDPRYYKWTQWIFIKLFEKGLAYKRKMSVNWCPKDKIVLANEEAAGGVCERCGTPVEKRDKEQWLIRITKYANRLIEDLKLVDYPQRVKDQQINWIGKSEGVEIKFEIRNSAFTRELKLEIPVFTTRADTIFGCTFLVLAPEHPILEKLQPENKNEVREYIKHAKNKSELERKEQKDKTGIELKKIKAVNPATKREIPIFIADYVMMGYGTGAIMAVPAHDQRDFEFAKKYKLPIKEVIVPNIVDKRNPPVPGKKFVERKNVHAIVKDPDTGKYLALKWKEFDWTTFPMGGIEEGEDAVAAARREIKEETGFTNVKLVRVLPGRTRAEYFAAHKDENRISYTTAVIFELLNKEHVEISQKEKDAHDIIWLDKKDLDYDHMTHAEVGLWKEQLESEKYAYTGNGFLVDSGQFSGMDSQKATTEITRAIGGKKTVHYKLRDWIFSRQRYWGEPIPMIHCKKCGWMPVPEKDLPVELPPVKKYEPTDTGESPLSAIESWVQVKCPQCKSAAQRETDTMPTWAGSNWYFLRYTDPKNSKALADKKILQYWMPVDFYDGGMEHTTLHLLYSRFIFKFLWDVGAVPSNLGSEPYRKRIAHGIVLAAGSVKMSKSKGNVINPDDVVKQYGADTLRVYEMFMGPFEQMIPWDDKGIIGARRFLEKVYQLAHNPISKASNEKLVSLLHKTIKKVGGDIDETKFNTAVSAMMEFTNAWYVSEGGLNKKDIQKFLVILSPFAPHMAEELWRALKFTGSCANQAWPVYDERVLRANKTMLIVQVDGRVRDKVEIAAGTARQDAENIAMRQERVKNWISGKKIKKIVFIPDKLINIVLYD